MKSSNRFSGMLNEQNTVWANRDCLEMAVCAARRGRARVDFISCHLISSHQITRLLVKVQVRLVHLLACASPRPESVHQVVGQRDKLVVLVACGEEGHEAGGLLCTRLFRGCGAT